MRGIWRNPQSGGRLVGALLVGDLPRAYQYVRLASTNPDIPSAEEEVISYQFYSDLDGTFAASPGYTSPAGRPFSFDLHEGAVDWEIWIGALPRNGGDLAASAAAVNGCFAKNHAATAVQHNFLLSELRTGQYAWTPWSAEPSAMIYFDSPPGGLSVQQGCDGIGRGDADFFNGGARVVGSARTTHTDMGEDGRDPHSLLLE